MDRYLLFMSWRGEGGPEGPSGLTAAGIYDLLEINCNASVNAELEQFPACSLAGAPDVREWYFAIQSICGFYQFCSTDWEEISFDLLADQSNDSVRRYIEECLGGDQNIDKEDSNSREAMSVTELYEESAENIHQLADKLPAPGRAMVDVILQSSERDAPRLNDCLPVIGALKHLREWHAAKITIVAKEGKTSWQKIADYLSAHIVAPENLNNSIDPRELWRGRIQIWEQKFGSEITFPDFCIRSTTAGRLFSTLYFDKTERTKSTNARLPKVFLYYSPALKFVQMVRLSDMPSCFVSDLHFDLSLARTSAKDKSMLFWSQMSSLPGKVGALFVLPCSVSGMLIPLPTQLSTKKWKEYIAQKPKVISVPEVELKGETCNNYFLVQGDGCGGCKATLIYSANQINGSVGLAETIGKRTINTEEAEESMAEEIIRSLPFVSGEQILQREKKLACIQALALNQCLTKPSLIVSAEELKCMLTRTRERFLELWNASLPKSDCPITAVKNKGHGTSCESELKHSTPLEWPERNVLQNLENFEKTKQKPRISEQLLGRKDSQKESTTSLDAKELLKFFTPEGQPVGNLQPLHIQKSENAFLLTPELTPGKVRSLPFEKAAGCHYHGLEYCLDNRRALERDEGFAELQTRLIRYETQTTCTKECCPVPCVLSPLPSPAVLSEPGSIPDGESLRRDHHTDVSKLKCRSRDQDGFCSKKRLMKSESTDSLLSQASGSSGACRSRSATRQDLDRSISLSSVAAKPSCSRAHKVTAKDSSASWRGTKEPEASKPAKESRSQKHTRMLKEVVSKTLQAHGIAEDHKCFTTCSQRLFEISKFYLKDLKTSRGLLDEMTKAANSNVKQVIEWVLEKATKK
ncbi:PREDICTED: mdm2-binding protein [Gekko japonicus]|uniref:Mdm2-binding protein n=1 Tax=Gekko japonicus TaxID=146911 RepID=A0ABM1K1C4_GEKJA|nr:PREDICTED: mdm2-binding protein [Gekko japonicus]